MSVCVCDGKKKTFECYKNIPKNNLVFFVFVLDKIVFNLQSFAEFLAINTNSSAMWRNEQNMFCASENFYS